MFPPGCSLGHILLQAQWDARLACCFGRLHVAKVPSHVCPSFRYPVPSGGGSDESDGSGSDRGGK